MTDSPTYIETFDDMKTWMSWRASFIDSTKSVWEKQFVHGIFEDRIVSVIKAHVASILATVDWIPVIHELQQRYCHDIVKLAHEPFGKLQAICSCGLVADVPPRLSRKYPRKVEFLMFTAGKRQPAQDQPLEQWFFSISGHRDLYYGDDARCFVSVSSAGGGSVTRDVVCQACGQVTPLKWIGKFALFRPDTYRENIERHRAVCARWQVE